MIIYLCPIHGKGAKAKKIPSLLLKLDISKAFDLVSWEFLLKLLQFRGFGRRWCGWIAALFLATSTKVLVNSMLSDVIHHRKGLRQGDPLSPLLFVLVMDCLGRLMDKAQTDGVLAPLGQQQLRHRASIYADDVMIFIKPAEEDIQAVTQILDVFGGATGLHTNLAKSKILPIRCDGLDMNPLQHAMGCQLATFPCTYLGMPLSDKKLKKNDLQIIIDKLAKKAASWKGKWISIDGRLILVKFVMAVMPIYQLLAIDFPKWTMKQIEKLQRAFLWAGSDKVSGGKFLVKWTQLCQPIRYGGLGIPNLSLQGTALKMRWLWLNKTDKEKPWQGLPVPSSPEALAIFKALTTSLLAMDQAFYSGMIIGCKV